MSKKRKYQLGNKGYQRKPNSNDFVKAVNKVQAFLQDEENRVNGKNAQEVTYGYATQYIYDNFLKGKRFG